MQIQQTVVLSGLGLVILLLIVVTYAGARTRKQNPSLFRRYLALVVIVGVILSTTIVVVINLPPPREIELEIELDITLDFKSNSTADECTIHYHWDAPGIRSKVVNGIQIDWRQITGESRSDGTGALYDLLENNYVMGIDIYWAEFELFTNETWTLQLKFFVGAVFDGQIILQGDSEVLQIESYQMTRDYYPTRSIDGMESLGIEGLEVFMDFSFNISAQVLQSCFQVNSIETQISTDFQLVVNDIEFGTISG